MAGLAQQAGHRCPGWGMGSGLRPGSWGGSGHPLPVLPALLLGPARGAGPCPWRSCHPQFRSCTAADHCERIHCCMVLSGPCCVSSFWPPRSMLPWTRLDASCAGASAPWPAGSPPSTCQLPTSPQGRAPASVGLGSGLIARPLGARWGCDLIWISLITTLSHMFFVSEISFLFFFFPDFSLFSPLESAVSLGDISPSMCVLKTASLPARGSFVSSLSRHLGL